MTLAQQKDKLIQALEALLSRTVEECERTLLHHCHQVLIGQASAVCVPTTVLAHAKRATGEADCYRRLGAYYLLTGRDGDAFQAIDLSWQASLGALPKPRLESAPALASTATDTLIPIAVH